MPLDGGGTASPATLSLWELEETELTTLNVSCPLAAQEPGARAALWGPQPGERLQDSHVQPRPVPNWPDTAGLGEPSAVGAQSLGLSQGRGDGGARPGKSHLAQPQVLRVPCPAGRGAGNSSQAAAGSLPGAAPSSWASLHPPVLARGQCRALVPLTTVSVGAGDGGWGRAESCLQESQPWNSCPATHTQDNMSLCSGLIPFPG